MKVRRLRHPNLALDPPPGFTLAEKVKKRPLTPVEARRFARDVLSGLRHAHAMGIVHGELSADCVVLDGERWVIHGFSGRGEERDDVRGAGALFHVALTGEEPSGTRMLALPRAFRAVVVRSLAEAGRRYGTVAEMAAALQVAAPAPVVPRRRWWIPAVLFAVLGAAGAAFGAKHLVRARPLAVAAPTSPLVAPRAPAPDRRVVTVAPFSASGDATWLGAGAAEMVATVLAEAPTVEVVGAGGRLTVEGSVEKSGAGWTVAARIVDGDTTLAAERVTVARADDMVVRIGELAARMTAVVAPGTKPASLAKLTSGSPAAWQAYLDGDEAGLRKALEVDPHFFQAAARLLQLLVADDRADEAEPFLAAARAEAPHAGTAAMWTLARLSARTPLQQVAALEAEMAHAPEDLALAAQLASAYRSAGRVTDCAAMAERAGAPAIRDLALCRLAAGDGTGALAAASASEDPVLAGDIALILGHHGAARDFYRKAGARAGARLLLVALRAQGKCKAPVKIDSVDDGRIAVALALACGDFSAAHAAEVAVKKTAPRVAEELAVEIAAARGEGGTLAKAQKRAADASLWAADGLDRGRRYGPIFAAARSEKHADVLTGFAPAPGDRWGLFEDPLLFDVALAQADLGSAEDAALGCSELAAADSPLALYCQGRAAEAASDWPGAFRAFRDFLDRWSDADPDHRLVREAIRRSKLAIVKARAPQQP